MREEAVRAWVTAVPYRPIKKLPPRLVIIAAEYCQPRPCASLTLVVEGGNWLTKRQAEPLLDALDPVAHTPPIMLREHSIAPTPVGGTDWRKDADANLRARQPVGKLESAKGSVFMQSLLSVSED